MDFRLLSWLDPGSISALAAALQNDVLLAGLIFVGIAALVALCVPGIIVPAAMTSGAMLGTWTAIGVVTLGALLGSQLFFLAARRFARERLRTKLGGRLEAFQLSFTAYGLWYVIGLRLAGAPHFLVTAGSALMPMRSTSFAAASLLGLLPVVAIAAAAGSTI